MVVEVELDLPHGHCDACFKRNCAVSPQPGNACSITDCESDCGARFHKCKAQEHRLICPNAKIQCINVAYGCPIELHRRLICKHLEVCPASVVNCTMEWNRWPVYASERQSQQPLQLVSDDHNQLDIALALRDQRMLTKSMKASKRTRQILTNALNRRHPAVPLAVQLTGTDLQDTEEEKHELEHLLHVMQEEKEAADRERARTPPGLQRSICNELYRQTRSDTNGSKSAATDGNPHFPPPPPGESFIRCSHCERRNERMERILASHDAMQEIGASGSEDLEAMDECDKTACTNSFHHDHVDRPPLHEAHNGASHCGDPSSDGLHHSSDGEDAAFLDINARGLDDPPRPRLQMPDYFRPQRASYTPPTFSNDDADDFPTPAVFVTQSTTGDVSAAPTRGHSKPIIIQPPLVGASSADKTNRSSRSSNGSLDSRHSLSLDLSLESITRYQAKPDSMYTFLCAQEFRRDEYPYHFQNVHSDIHGGLNGWMEQRCPLAPYGCTFSQRRLYPGSRGARIVHSENLESFGLCLDQSPVTTTSQDEESSLQFQKTNKLEDTTGVQTRTEQRSSFSSSNEDVKDDAKSIPKPSKDVLDQTCVAMETDDARMNSNEGVNRARSANSDQTNDPQEQDMDVSKGDGSDDGADGESGVDYLSQLPFELLRVLMRFLDSFTLSHVAMTSKLLRQVCCSLLEERGMVVLQWEKQKGHWDTTMKVWHFSTAFTPVKSWGFEDNPPIAEHLKSCPYNIRNIISKPVKVMGHEVPSVGLSADARECSEDDDDVGRRRRRRQPVEDVGDDDDDDDNVDNW